MFTDSEKQAFELLNFIVDGTYYHLELPNLNGLWIRKEDNDDSVLKVNYHVYPCKNEFTKFSNLNDVLKYVKRKIKVCSKVGFIPTPGTWI